MASDDHPTFKPLPDAARRLLDDANFAHLSTLDANGAPKSDPVWIAREGDQVLVATDGKSIKARNVAHDPRVALSVVAFSNPYEQVLIRGRVVEVRPDDELAVLDAMAQKYLGTAFPRRRWSDRVVLVIRATMVRPYQSALVDPRASRTGDVVGSIDTQRRTTLLADTDRA